LILSYLFAQVYDAVEPISVGKLASNLVYAWQGCGSALWLDKSFRSKDAQSSSLGESFEMPLQDFSGMSTILLDVMDELVRCPEGYISLFRLVAAFTRIRWKRKHGCLLHDGNSNGVDVGSRIAVVLPDKRLAIDGRELLDEIFSVKRGESGNA